MITIVDYGVGNLFSLQSSLSYLNVPTKVSRNPEDILSAERVILPGVGAFGDAIQKLHQLNLVELLQQTAQKGIPLLGICLGMQLLFEKSTEFGTHEGLGLLPGEVGSLEKDLRAQSWEYKVPHMGWNSLDFVKESPLLKYLQGGESMYYVHSYYAKNCGESIVGTSEYGIAIPGVVQRDNIFGTQFHPEKSGDDGLKILQAFAEVNAC